MLFGQFLKTDGLCSGVFLDKASMTFIDQHKTRVSYVIGPDGSPLTLSNLPPSDTRRWVVRRKAEVVAAVRGGLLSLEEACNRYTLTVDRPTRYSRLASYPRSAIPPLNVVDVDDVQVGGMNQTSYMDLEHGYHLGPSKPAMIDRFSS
jgi:Protein of unknown function (DUF1153)